jgi:5-methylcytosine-specific restriction endonuclease McrA
MLHERSLPQPEVNDLDRVYQVMLSLLDWLLRTPPAQLADRSPLVQQFGQPVAGWMWKRIHKPATRTKFGLAVMALAGRALAAPAEATAVAVSIAQDAQFHKRWDEVGYELQFPRLHAGWLDSVRAVAEPFYGWLADSGFDGAAFGLAGASMTRARIMAAFRPQSFGVCGYCDGPLGEVGTDTEANDCDHFFPKSQWPHLAIHPANLYSACMPCNSRWKLGKKPMGEADVLGLSETYHPLLRPGASRISVTAIQASTSTRRVAITIRDIPFPRRSETLNDTLDLEARWTNFINEKLDECVSTFVAKAVKDKGRGWDVTPDSVRELIENDIAWQRARRGKDERTIRQVAALEFQLTQHLPKIVADLS